MAVRALGEIAVNESRPFDFSQHDDVVFINTGDVLEGYFLHSDRVAKDDLPGQAKKRIKKGDILFSEIRPGNKRFALVDFEPDGYVVSTKFMVIRLTADDVDLDYFYKVLTCSSTLNEFQRIAESRSGTFPQITFDTVSYFPFDIPSLPEQQAIAHILGTLDDKIELNRQMNETLEAMAQALFKSWFVDFDPVIDNALAVGNEIPEPLQKRAAARQALGDQRKPLPADIQSLFPDRFVFTDEMSWIPEGWGACEVGEILNRFTIRKRYKKKDVAAFGSVPVYEQGADILLGYHNSVAEIDASETEPAFIFGDHTCVTKLSIRPFSISENVIALKGKGYNTYWVYFAIADKQHFEEYRRHWMELIVKYVVTPPVELADIFGLQVQCLIKKQQLLTDANSTLGRLRDTLLPKLLSGELRIPDAEQQVAEAL